MFKIAPTIQPLSMNHYKSRLMRKFVYTVCPAVYQNFEQKKMKLAPRWIRIQMLRTAPSIQPLSMNLYETRLLRKSVYTVCPAANQNDGSESRTAPSIQPLSTNHYKSRLLCEFVYTVCPAAYQNFEQKKTKLTPRWTRILTLRTTPTTAPFNKSL